MSKSSRRTILHLGGVPAVENDIGSENSCKILRSYLRLSGRCTCQLFGKILTVQFSLSLAEKMNLIADKLCFNQRRFLSPLTFGFSAFA